MFFKKTIQIDATDRCDPLCTAGRVIVDKSGRGVFLRGVNISQSPKRSPYENWQPLSDFQKLRDWGFNVIRLLVIWAAIEPEKGKIDLDYLGKLSHWIELADQVGLYVILDMHQDIFGDGFCGDGAPRWASDESLYASFEPRSPWYMN